MAFPPIKWVCFPVNPKFCYLTIAWGFRKCCFLITKNLMVRHCLVGPYRIYKPSGTSRTLAVLRVLQHSLWAYFKQCLLNLLCIVCRRPWAPHHLPAGSGDNILLLLRVVWMVATVKCHTSATIFWELHPQIKLFIISFCALFHVISTKIQVYKGLITIVILRNIFFKVDKILWKTSLG